MGKLRERKKGGFGDPECLCDPAWIKARLMIGAGERNHTKPLVGHQYPGSVDMQVYFTRIG